MKIPIKSKNRLYFFLVIMFLFYAIDLLNLVKFQLLDHDKYVEQALKQRKRLIKLSPKRGTIYDTNNRELAVSTDVDSVFINPRQLEITNKQIKKVAGILHISSKKMKKIAKSKRSFFWLKRQITPDEFKDIKVLDIKGIEFLKESNRYYPKNFLAGHTIGFSGIDNKGLEGIELCYDRELRGSEGWYFCDKDAKHRAITAQQRWVKKPSSGYDVVLTIDTVIQYFAERELRKVCLDEHAKSGSVIVMEPSTGAILAMANYPPFNPNTFKHVSPPSIWRNRSVVDLMEPGSTMKTFTYAAALSRKSININQTFDCSKGYVSYGGHKYFDWKKFGILTVPEVLAYSSNVGTINIGMSTGPENVYHYLKRFGFGAKTNIDFPGEPKGKLNSPKHWSVNSLPSISIGYEIFSSLIQMVSGYAVIANDGVKMKPRLVKELRNSNGEIVKFFPPQEVSRVLTPRTSHLLQKFLSNVIAWGTGHKAQIPGYNICGKTGTSKLYNSKLKRYSSRRIRATFIGFAPRKKPECVIGIVVTDPRKHRWGGSVASPVFQAICRDVLKYRHRLPTNIDTIVVNNLTKDNLKLDFDEVVKTARLSEKDLIKHIEQNR